jgi:hypothetical protein
MVLGAWFVVKLACEQENEKAGKVKMKGGVVFSALRDWFQGGAWVTPQFPGTGAVSKDPWRLLFFVASDKKIPFPLVSGKGFEGRRFTGPC